MSDTLLQLESLTSARPHHAIDKAARARQKSQRPLCLWLTGLSGSGKSTLANFLESRLFAAGRHTYLLDGDAIRTGLSRDLGFSEDDRNENIRRVAEVARLLTDAGLIVIVALISPYRAGRNAARALFAHDEFLEIFVDAPLAECERRDPKGLYARARRGLLPHFTGIDSQYEPPLLPEARLDTVAFTPDECVDQLLRVLDKQTLNRQSLASIPDPQSLGPQILGSECQAPRLLDPVA